MKHSCLSGSSDFDRFSHIQFSPGLYVIPHNQMIVEGSNFSPPASAESLTLLKQMLPRETPPDYFAFLEKADGGQIWFQFDASAPFDCIRIYSVSRMLELRASLETLLPSLVVIGGDQGSQFLGYDKSASAPWPIVMFLPGSAQGAAHVAMSFTELEQRYFRKIGEKTEL